MLASPPDLLRLIAVPVFAWAAYRDVRTRRVPNLTWPPLVGLAVLALAWDAWIILDADPYVRSLFIIRVGVSLALVAPMGYLFWRVGGFGGADAKAVMTVAVLFPTYPTFYLSFGALPETSATLGVFSLTVLTNTVLLGLAYPVVLALRNLLHGRVAPVMFVGRPVPTREVTEEYGRLLETSDGYTTSGLDLDALRMYLRWRNISLAAVRTHPDQFRDPSSLPAHRGEPGDGALPDGGDPPPDRQENADTVGPFAGEGLTDRRRLTGDNPTPPESEIQLVDQLGRSLGRDHWGAATFLAELDGGAYGTSADELRQGLEVLVSRDEVWITPGIPFIVPMFVGLLLALTYGDLMFGIMLALGLV